MTVQWIAKGDFGLDTYDPLVKEPVDEGTMGLLRERTSHEVLTQQQAFFSD